MEHPTPISARASVSDPSLATQGPIPLFDVHLRFLTDSYITFFQERKRIEETYIDSLTRLHRKTTSVDAFLDEKTDITTTRRAWSEVIDNLEREVQTRKAFSEALAKDIILPLTTFKETQERTRKRIKEDLKDSTSAYNDYAEVMLPKLKSRYTKKYGEVEEQKKSSAGPLLPPSSTSQQQGSNFKSEFSNLSRPLVTAPQPLRALDRRPSGSGGPARARSPSSSTAFSDLAHQGKKQFGQLIGLLDKGTAMKELGGRENNALRAVRAKRDADEADKEYRKGVHWLETLRLRRTKILENGFMSLNDFVKEEAVIIKQILQRYTDHMFATNTTQTQLSTHTRNVIDKISPETDTAQLAVTTSRSLASAIPDRILYEHGEVGSCNDLIFGFSLGDYATAKGLREGEVPRIVRICIAEIDKRGLDAEGIYRISGRHAAVQTMQHNIEKDEAALKFDPKDDIYAVASLLKLYLRELPEPLFRFPLQDRMQHTENIAEHQANNFMLLRSKMRRLPAVHQATLRALVEHLARVASHSEKNKMDAKNLAIVFGTMIFGEDELPKGGDLLSVQTHKDTLMEDLILNAYALFDDHAPQQAQSPPLPPTPAGEVALEVKYGSRTTKVATLPPKSHSPPNSPQDFMPKLPPRPTTSIHPSSRAHPTSPDQRAEMPLLNAHDIASGNQDSSLATPIFNSNILEDIDESLLYVEADSSVGREPTAETNLTSHAISRTASRTHSRPPSRADKNELPPTPQESPAISPIDAEISLFKR